MSLLKKKKESASAYEEKWEAALLDFLRSGEMSGILIRTMPYMGNRLYRFSAPSATSLSCVANGREEVYNTTIRCASKLLLTECTCDTGINCKHSLALALVLAWRAQKEGHELPRDIRLRYEEAFDELDQSGITPPNIDKILGPSSSVRSKTALSNSLPDDWWETIASNCAWREQESIFNEVLKARLPNLPFWSTSSVTQELRKIKNPIHRLRQIEPKIEELRLGNRYVRGPSVVTDPALQAFLASPRAAELESRYDREIAQSDLIEWLNRSGSYREEAQHSSLLNVIWESFPVQDGMHALYFQLSAEAGQRGMVARKPTGIDTIASEVSFGKRNFGVDQNKLVRWISNKNVHGYSDSLSPIVPVDETFIPVKEIYQWISTWSKLVRWHDGGSIGLSPWTAELTLSADDKGEPRWVVKFPAQSAGGAREIPFAETTILVDNTNDYADLEENSYTYFIREKDNLTRLDTHGMSPEILSAIRKIGSLPMDVLAGTPAGSALFHVLSQGRESAGLRNWVQEFACDCTVELAVDADSEFAVTARAKSMDLDGPVFGWSPHAGWTSGVAVEHTSEEEIPFNDVGNDSTEPPAAGDSVQSIEDSEISTPSGADPALPDADKRPHLHSLPRREDVAELEHWLESVVACVSGRGTADNVRSFTGRLRPSAMTAMLSLWEQRPAGVEYYGNKEFRKLITVRAAPRIFIQTESSGMDWLKVSVSLEKEINQTSLAEMSKVLAANADRFVRLANGRVYRRSELEEYRDQIDQLNALGLSATPGEQKLHALHLAGAPPEVLSRLESGGDAFAALAAKSRKILRDFSGVPEATIDPDILEFLRPYQRAGVNFLVWAANNFGGALLADDMGLGKTLQMLAAICALRDAAEADGNKPGPSLVVCPASVAHNWQREANRFTPKLKVMVLESGAGRRKHLKDLENYDLVILNFALLRRDVETLEKVAWFAIVADEAQAIKNPNSESSRSLKNLAARYRFALTGTPIENRIADLYSIVEFALPGYLGELDKSTSSTDPESAARACRLLRSRLRPVLIRRLKAEVAPELPERVETRMDCEMGTAQKKLYAAEVKRVRMMLDGMSETGVKGKHRIEMLAALMRLRQICCDPMLLGHPEISSGKTEELLELVPPLLEAGHKVLIFSQFVKMLNHLEEQLAEKDIRTYKLTGATTNRQALVDRFENDPEPAAFLISLKAGGTGLNLVSASHVILFDPWWNPSVEAQAIDRTHRIGQDKTVVAYRLVTVGTIEERILELQERKRALVRNILEEDSFNRTLTSEDFQYLLGG